jgi:hypothetical protein
MMNGQDATLVLKDQAGNYFLLPQASLERGRVAEEFRTTVEGLVAGSKACGHSTDEDVSGYSMVTVLALAETRVRLLLTGLESFPPFQPRRQSP